jgi:FAD:protein FMN transferase
MVRRCRPLLGTFVEITASDEGLCEAGFSAIVEVQRLLSAHDPASELSAINRTAHLRPVAVHRWTEAVLRRALFWAEASDGTFDPTVGGLMAARGLLPADSGAPAVDPLANWHDVRLQDGAVHFGRPLRLDLGGIAKGFAVDCAVDAMRDAGADCGFVNAGGDVRAFGGSPWTVTIVSPGSRRPLAIVTLRDAALATSAPHAGRSRLDIRHLLTADGTNISVSIEAPSAMDADALTKILMAGVQERHHYLELAGASALLIAADERITSLDTRELAP